MPGLPYYGRHSVTLERLAGPVFALAAKVGAGSKDQALRFVATTTAICLMLLIASFS